MCGYIKEVLNTIKEPFVCVIDGVSLEYENGAAAIERLTANLKATHSIDSIGINGGRLCVTIVDCQLEIDKSNKAWMAEQKEETGVEPSFF